MLLLVAAFVFGEGKLSQVAYFLDVGVPPRLVDCAMALPGDAERRPFVVAALANAGLAQTLLIPSGQAMPDAIDGLMPSSAEIAKRIYLTRGVPPERIVVQAEVTTSTVDDLEQLGDYLDRQSLNRKTNVTAAVVTSAFHTRRTRWTIDVRLPDHASRIIVVSAPNPRFSNATWWRSRVGFRYVILEYLKLGYYWYRFGNGIYWSGAAMVSGFLWLIRGRRTSAKSDLPVAVKA
jgi:uncharacterized SAM-binding protein YcdF (DUF218 family)